METTAHSDLWSTQNMEIRTTPLSSTAPQASTSPIGCSKKGRLIEIIGNLNLRPYETDEGIRQISADVSVLEWHFTGSKPKGDEADSSQGTTKTAQKSTGKVRPEQTISSGDDDDDLPL